MLSQLTEIAETLPAWLDWARVQLFAQAGWIVAAAAGAALLSDLLAARFRVRDDRIGFLARFLDVSEDDIIPLPPATALWVLYAQRNREADAHAELPPGGQTLQASYLVRSAGTLVVVAVHNFEEPLFYTDPDGDGEIIDTIGGRPSVAAGAVLPDRFPVEIETDAARRADLVTYLLKYLFRMPGDVGAMVLLRDAGAMAPAPEFETTRAGHDILRADFSDPKEARAALMMAPGKARVEDWGAVRRWFERWPGRTTSPRRRIWRLVLVALGLSFGAVTAGLVDLSAIGLPF